MKLKKLDKPDSQGRRYEVRYREAGRGSRNPRKRFSTKEAGERFIARLQAQRELGVDIAAQDQTLAQLASDWLKRHVVNLGPRTQDDYATSYDNHIAPHLGHLKLRDISLETVQDWRVTLERDGVGRSSVRRAMIVLQSILTRGVKWHRIPRNVARDAEKPSGRRRRAVVAVPPATVEAIRGALIAQERHGDATLVSVLAYAGLRPQEALALEWRHIGKQSLLVEQKNISGEIHAGNKSRAEQLWHRSIDLEPGLREDLRDWMLRTGRRDGLVFPTQAGQPWKPHDYRNWTRRVWHDVAPDGMTPYDLRHSFASMHLRAGESIVELAAQLGHAPTLTLDTYGHVIRELKGQPHVAVPEQIRRARRPAKRKEAAG